MLKISNLKYVSLSKITNPKYFSMSVSGAKEQWAAFFARKIVYAMKNGSIPCENRYPVF